MAHVPWSLRRGLFGGPDALDLQEKTVMDRIAVNQREKFEAIAQITKKER